jgi:hypothetical protein
MPTKKTDAACHTAAEAGLSCSDIQRKYVDQTLYSIATGFHPRAFGEYRSSKGVAGGRRFNPTGVADTPDGHRGRLAARRFTPTRVWNAKGAPSLNSCQSVLPLPLEPPLKIPS